MRECNIYQDKKDLRYHGIYIIVQRNAFHIDYI